MQVPIGQHPLRQRAEGDDALLQPGCGFLQAVLLDRPVKDGIAVLIDEERAVKLLQNSGSPLQGGSVIIGKADI